MCWSGKYPDLENLFFDAAMRDLANLGEAVNSLADFGQDMAVLGERWEIVCVDDFLGNRGDGDACIRSATSGC